jgi:twinkle protein
MTIKKKSKIIQKNQPCPKCPSSDAYQIYDDGQGHCFSCNYHKGLEEVEYTSEFIHYRGIPAEIMKFYGVKTYIDPNGQPNHLKFPYGNGMLCKRLDVKKFYIEDELEGMFGMNRFDPACSDAIIITEGAADAMAAYHMLGRKFPCISVQSGSTSRRDCERARDYISTFNRIYLSFDNDDVGQREAVTVASLFDPSRVYIMKHVKHKDANAYLENRDEEAYKAIFRNTKSHEPIRILSSFADIREALRSPNAEHLMDFPFRTLQDMTLGIFAGQRILVKALPGVGKTEIIRSLEYYGLKTTDWNIGAIHLEEPKTRTIKGIAGYELKRPVHMPNTGLTEDEIFDAYIKGVGRDNRYHIYSHFGSDDPSIILDTIRKLASVNSCRLIFFDHISIAVSGLAEDDERRALDQISTRLAMLTEELQFACIFVSHVNDQGQTRGSRAMNQIADVTIRLERDYENADKEISNTTILTVTKPSRITGLAGPAGKLLFDPKTFMISETDKALPF